MKNYMIISAIFSMVVMLGCTSPTQPIAADALSRGVSGFNKTFDDMGRVAKQEILNSTAGKVNSAVEKQDPKSAAAALREGFNKRDDIEWLYIQKERSMSLIRIGQEFVWAQKGILNIMWDDWQKAKENTEEPTSQPSTQPSN